MLGFFIGILLCTIIALALVIVWLIKKPKTELQKQTEEEIRKMKEYNKHYDDIINFNVNKAYSGGHNV